MQKTLKTLTALGLIFSAFNAVQAEETVKKCDCGSVAEDYFSKCSQKSLTKAMETGIPMDAFQLGLNGMKPELEKLLANFKDNVPLSEDIKKECAALSRLISLASAFEKKANLSKENGTLSFEDALIFTETQLRIEPHLTQEEKKVLIGLLKTGFARGRKSSSIKEINEEM